MEQELEFLHSFDARCSTYFALTPPVSMVKVAFRPYGYEVHKALHSQGYAPALLGFSRRPAIGADAIVMEYLPPPTNNTDGWITLFDLSAVNPVLVHEKKQKIQQELDEMILFLTNSSFVHGDLRSNNIMIFGTFSNIVEPIQLKAIDMEWAGKAGVVCYPTNRNSKVGYPGEAGGCIDSGHDAQMVTKWLAQV